MSRSSLTRTTGRGTVLVAVLMLQGSSGSLAATGTWRATALATTDSPISDLPGGRFVEFGNAWARPDGEVVFGARLAGREEKRSWALFSLRDGAIRTILEEGDEVASRYAAEPGRRFHFHATGIWHRVTDLFNGPRFVFSSNSSGFESDSGVFSWDGEQIRPLIVPGQTIGIGGRSEPIRDAGVVAAVPSGEILVSLRTEKPFKTVATAVFDGERLRPLVSEDGAMPMWNQVRLLPGGDCLALINAGKRNQAVVQFSAGGMRRLLESGSAHPLDSKLKIGGFELLAAKSATRFVTLIYDDQGGSRYVLFDADRRFDLTPPELLATRRWSFTLRQIEFLDPERPILLYKAHVSFQDKKGERIGTNLFLFDGTAVHWLVNRVYYDTSDLTRIARVTAGPFPGALVNVLLGPMPSGKLPDAWPLAFLDLHDPAAGFEPVPQLELEGGRRIGLEAVRAWPSATIAIAVVAGEGIYRLEESASPAP